MARKQKFDNFDSKCLKVLNEKGMNMMVPWYLIASYGYYIEDDSILSDTLYDTICKSLLDNFDKIDHFHKHLLDKSALEAGSAYHLIADDYPERVKGGYIRLTWERFVQEYPHHPDSLRWLESEKRIQAAEEKLEEPTIKGLDAFW